MIKINELKRHGELLLNKGSLSEKAAYGMILTI